MSEWIVFSNQQGLGVARQDYHWGMWMSMYANAHRGESDPPYMPNDFMPYFDEFEEDITLEELKQRIRGKT